MTKKYEYSIRSSRPNALCSPLGQPNMAVTNVSEMDEKASFQRTESLPYSDYYIDVSQVNTYIWE